MRLRVFRYFIGIALLVGISILLFRRSDLPDTLRALDALDLLSLLLLSVLIFGVLATQFRLMIRVYGLRLPFREWFGLTAINSMCSYYLPARAGLFVRGAYLKAKYDFPVSDYTALVLTTQLFLLAVTGMAGILMTMVCASGCERYSGILIAVFAVVAAGSLLAFLVLPRLLVIPGRSRRLQAFLDRVRAGFTVWRGCPGQLLLISCINLVLIGLRAFRLLLCFAALGIPVSFAEVMVVQMLLAVAFVVSFTPGNLGVKEGLIVLCAGLLGVTADAALAASLLDRAFAVIVIAVFGMLSMKILLPGSGLNSRDVTGTGRGHGQEKPSL